MLKKEKLKNIDDKIIMKTDLDEVKILYKYRHFDSENLHIKTILSNEFYFASKDQLNDPQDLALRPLYEEMTAEQFIEKARMVYGSNKNLSPEEKERLINTMIEEIEEDIDGVRNRYIDTFKLQMSTVRICSFTADKWNDSLMWAHYCNDHRGFCIGLNWPILSHHLMKHNEGLVEPDFVLPLVVEYVNEVKRITVLHGCDDETYRQAFCHKHNAWEYENEVRILCTIPNNAFMWVLDEFIEEVILGYKISDSNKSIIIEALKLKTHKPKLYQIVPKENDFKFDRIMIDY